MPEPDPQQDVDLVAAVGDTIPRILEVVCRTTGMGFAAVARVTDSRWICCSVRDEIGFGLRPGGELQLETTICNEIRQDGQAVVIDEVAADAGFCGHPTPAQYGFQSYISYPIVRAGTGFWGTLCAIDPRPAVLRTPAVQGMFELFAELIAFHLDAQERLRASESALLDVRRTARLREEFIAVLGHDLRNPLQSIATGLAAVTRAPEQAPRMLPVMQRSVKRMEELVANLMDFARGRLGAGIQLLAAHGGENLPAQLQQVVQELSGAWPGRRIDFQADLQVPVDCDPARIAQLLSNLLQNALKHGDAQQPVTVEARSAAGAFTLAVTNHGPDIPPDVQARLFEPYFRGTGARHEGLGLGLYIVSEIARAHRGSVAVESAGGLTRFTLRMPA